MILDTNVRTEVQALLEEHRLPRADISASDGFANLVVLTPDHVIRLNGGRFPDAFRHEATVLNQLPQEIPHPVVVAQGKRKAGGEFLILDRLPGENLEQAWPRLTASDRVRIVQEVGSILKCLHNLPLADWMHNPWVEDALAAQRWEDAYHAPPDLFPQIVARAAIERPDLAPLLDSVSEFISARMFAFGHEPVIFIHTDLHFRNVIVDAGHVTGLIDFEGSRTGARDVEIDMLVRSLAPDDHRSRSRFPGTIPALREVYPELFSNPHLVTRIEVHEALWHLVQLHHWRPGHTWTTDPGVALEVLVSGAFSERIIRMMDEGTVSGIT